jgi:hypothetical protein
MQYLPKEGENKKGLLVHFLLQKNVELIIVYTKKEKDKLHPLML